MSVKSEWKFRKSVMRRAYALVEHGLSFFADNFYDFTVEGIENVPRVGPCIILPRHQRYADPLFVGLALREIPEIYPTYVMRPVKLLGSELPTKLLKYLGALPVYRPEELRKFDRKKRTELTEKIRKKNDLSMAQFEEELSNGGHVIVFPEGRRNGEMGNLKDKFFKWAVEHERVNSHKVSFVPVGISYSRDGERVDIRFGERVYHDGEKGVESLVEKCYEKIRELSVR
ncbi:1-acyl-sn-glycerol-3-phosphate acyltransferase [Candidatus Pacearchaeota archaeon]|nr:1-acyl-sn-glycerol-3-phosphate acyltransferase [Candidatus Pacearchaeota archaeon]